VVDIEPGVVATELADQITRVNVNEIMMQPTDQEA